MTQEIRLGAILQRDAQLWLVRASGGRAWELPGGVFGPEHDDVDEAMAALLRRFGVEVADPAGSFVETVRFALPGGTRVIYNLYAPLHWAGEPRPPDSAEGCWVRVRELEQVAMEPAVHEAVLHYFGLRERQDDAEEIAKAFQAFLASEESSASPAPPPPADRREAALAAAGLLMGGEPAAAYRLLRRDYRELAEDIVDFAFGSIWTHPGLDRKTRSLLVVAILATEGRPTALRAHIRGALNHGATREELVETLRTVAAYAGFPAALEAWPVMEEVLSERERRQRRRKERQG